jgi:hypothetical protein
VVWQKGGNDRGQAGGWRGHSEKKFAWRSIIKKIIPMGGVASQLID